MPRKPKPLEELSPAYRRRIERLMAQGFTRSQARGHARTEKGELPVSQIRPRPKPQPIVKTPAKIFTRFKGVHGDKFVWKYQEFSKNEVENAWKYTTRYLRSHAILTIVYGKLRIPREQRQGGSVRVVNQPWKSDGDEEERDESQFECTEQAYYQSIHQMCDVGMYKQFFPSPEALQSYLNANFCEVLSISVRFKVV